MRMGQCLLWRTGMNPVQVDAVIAPLPEDSLDKRRMVIDKETLPVRFKKELGGVLFPPALEYQA